MAVHIALPFKLPQRKYPKEPAQESKKSGFCRLFAFWSVGFLSGELFATLSPAPLNNSATCSVLHALKETVLALAVSFLGLICSLWHRISRLN